MKRTNHENKETPLASKIRSLNIMMALSIVGIAFATLGIILNVFVLLAKIALRG